jgi:hypothetical protein
MKTAPSANIAAKPNVWCQPTNQDVDADPYFLQPIIPGDLLVHFLKTRDVRTTRRELTARQHVEYEQSRFFQNFAQEGLAFEELE